MKNIVKVVDYDNSIGGWFLGGVIHGKKKN